MESEKYCVYSDIIFYSVTSPLMLEHGKDIWWTNKMISKDAIVGTTRSVLYCDWKDE